MNKLTPEEEARMWRDSCGQAQTKLQKEIRQRIWFQDRYRLLCKALSTVHSAMKAFDVTKDRICSNCGGTEIMMGFCAFCSAELMERRNE